MVNNFGTRGTNDTAIDDFWDDLSANVSSLLKAYLATGPNIDYENSEKSITQTYNKHFPEKCVKFNKYKHRRSNSTTSDMLKTDRVRVLFQIC